MWQRPGPTGALEPAFGREGTRLIRAVGVGLLLAVYMVLYLLGMARY
jgi:hypothetical protein